MPNTAKKTGKSDIRTFIKSFAEPGITRLLDILHIQDSKDHDYAVSLMGDLMTEVGDNPSHPANTFMDLLTDAIEQYENRIYGPPPKATPLEIIEFLMEQHGLTQSDLSDVFGGQASASLVLSGKRELNIRQIRKLAERFNIDAALLI